LRVLNLNDIIRNLLKMLQRIIGEHIEIKNGAGGGSGAGKKQIAGQLEQVLMNLSVNARDAMPEGGRLMLETRTSSWTMICAAPRGILARAAQPCLSFPTRGWAWTQRYWRASLNAFFTTKRPGHGTGLGLAMVYGVVKQSGGYIGAYSESGERHHVQNLFAAGGGDGGDCRIEETATTSKQGSETILLVEDDAAVRDLVSAMLTAQGYTVLVRNNRRCGNDLRTAFRAHSPAYHGYGSAGDERARDREASWFLAAECESTFHVGYSDEALVHSHGFDGKFQFLQKPFSSVTLTSKVREVLDGAGLDSP